LKEKENEIRGIFQNELAGCVNYSIQQWEDLHTQLVEKKIRLFETHVTGLNVQGVVLRYCVEFGLFDVGMAYYRLMIKGKDESLSDQILSRYLNLCALNRKYLLENKEEILAIYKKLLKAPVVEPIIVERCISVITAYKEHWRESFDLLSKISLVSHPTPATYFYIIQACFNFDDADTGWAMMRDFARNSERRPNSGCYLAYLDYCKRKQKAGQFEVKHLEDLFEFWEDFYLRIPELPVVSELEKLVFSLSDDQFQWSLKETYVPKNGVCTNCKKMLEPVKITETEFQDLCRHFVKKVVIGSNVFLKSTPGEVDAFKRFLNQAQPYDIVIDGLNVAYARGGQSPLQLATRVRCSSPEH